jgi:hypothetical protein
MMDMAVDSKIVIFSPTEKALQNWRHPGSNPSHDADSVHTEPAIVDTNDLLDCTNDDEVTLSLFTELFGFDSDLESELDTRMEEVLRLNSDYCPLVATAATIPMQST